MLKDAGTRLRGEERKKKRKEVNKEIKQCGDVSQVSIATFKNIDLQW